MTLEQWGREWLKYKRDYVKESTYANYLFLMERQVFPNLGRIEVEALDSVILQHTVMHWLKWGRIRWRGRTFTKDGAGYSDDPENVSEGLWKKIWADDAGMAGGTAGQTVGGKQTEAGGFIERTATEDAGMDPAGIEL